MFDGTRNFFVENVLPSYEEYIRQRQRPIAGESQDLRLAVNAATALYHFWDHIPVSDKQSREKLAASCPDYGLLDDIVNAYKHSKLDAKRHRYITSASSLSELIVITEHEDEQGKFQVAHKIIEIALKDGAKRDLGEVLTNVLNMWIDELATLGVLSVSKRTLPAPSTPTREQANGAAFLDLRARKGERFQQHFALRKFDPATGEAVPIDLTGSQLRFSLYKAIKVIAVQATNKRTGEMQEIVVALTPEQANQLQTIIDETARTEFVARILEQDQEFISLKRDLLRKHDQAEQSRDDRHVPRPPH